MHALIAMFVQENNISATEMAEAKLGIQFLILLSLLRYHKLLSTEMKL